MFFSPFSSHSESNHHHHHFINKKKNKNMFAYISESCGTPPTTPLTPLDELALRRHRFVSTLIDAAHSAISNNRIRFDQLASFDFSPCTDTATNSKLDLYKN